MMAPDANMILYFCIFLAVALLVAGTIGIVSDLRRGEGRNINRRLQLIQREGNSQAALQILRRSTGGLLHSTGFAKLLAQSGLALSVVQFLSIMAGIALAAFLFALWAGLGQTWSVLLTAGAGVLLPLAVVKNIRRRRMNKFGAQLPDALDVIVRSLLAGHPVSVALAMVAKEMPDPIGSEFGIAVDEMTYGLSAPEALANMAKRIEHPDLDLMIVSIKIQYGTGGNLAEVLRNLSSVIRARFRMFGKIRALSAEGRLSAIILTLMPFVVILAVNLITPGYYDEYAGDPRLFIILSVGLVWMIAGIYAMYRTVKFRV